ncbi:MAG TPA: hypothetical protein VF432_23145 [Thermoanaerobaculia bacterium]
MRRKKTGPDFDGLRLSTPAAEDQQLPKFTYTLNPNSGEVSSTISSVLTVTNPSTVFPVMVTAGSDLIAVSGWGGITQAPKSIEVVPPADSDWNGVMTDSSLGTILKLFTTADVEVQPLQSLAFTLNGILLDDQVGSADLAVMEIVGTQISPPKIAFGKLGAKMQIFAWADANSVGAGESTNINWTIVKGLYVTLLPPDDGTQYPRSGTGPYTASSPRTPFQNAPQTIFTATVFQQPDTPIPFTVPLLLSPPVITRFLPKDPPPIPIDGVVNLSWSVAYSPEVTLQPARGSKYVSNEGVRAVKPRDFLPNNADTVVFVLSAAGYQGPVAKSVTVRFLPMHIAYFRYPNFDEVGYTVSAPNSQTYGVSQLGPKHFRLDAIGPGGPLTQELGGTGLEIQVVVADPAQPKAGEATKLKYQVQAATSLKLMPGDVPLTFDASGRGETTVTPPAGSTTYTLVATGSNSKTVSSEITITTASSLFARRRRPVRK